MAETRFHRTLKERVEAKILLMSETLSSGSAQDYASYRDTVGHIRGLRDALVVCQEIEEDFK